MELAQTTCSLTALEDINEKFGLREGKLSEKEVERAAKRLKAYIAYRKQKLAKTEAVSQCFSDEVGNRNEKLSHLENQVKVSEEGWRKQTSEVKHLKSEMGEPKLEWIRTNQKPMRESMRERSDRRFSRTRS
jgi:uncharacterized protein (DUF3084 family)